MGGGIGEVPPPYITYPLLWGALPHLILSILLPLKPAHTWPLAHMYLTPPVDLSLTRVYALPRASTPLCMTLPMPTYSM